MAESKPSDTFKPGDVLNNTYLIEAVLGRGGTSEVYRARNEISRRQVAIKVLRSEFSANEDFLMLMTREEAMRDIRHDAVVRYSENHRTSTGLVYLVMDYVKGPALEEKMRTGGMSAEDLLVVAARVAEGLQAAHSRNITHRDLSPDNIILRDGIPAEAVIIDFGIAKDDNPGAETIVGNEFAGKYAYAAPEQLNGKSDPRSDIYALGALLLATFRGAVPDVGKNPMEVIRNKGLPLDTTGLPEPFKALIDRMTQPDPAQRLQTAMEVLTQIDPAYGTTLVPKRPVTMPPGSAGSVLPASPAKPKPVAALPAQKSHAGLMIGLVAVLLLAVGGGGFALGVWQKLLGLGLPVADPYTLVVERIAGAPPRIVGYVPDAGTKAALEVMVAPVKGEVQVDLASGEIGPDWAAGIIALLKAAGPLDEFRIAVSGNEVRLTGETNDRAVRDQIIDTMSGSRLPAGFTGSVEVVLGPRFLAAATVQAILAENQDCGPLEQRDPPVAGYGIDSPIVVTGRLADTTNRIRLFDAITAKAGDRKIVIDVDVLNETLCLIDAALPKAPSGGFGLAFGFGDRPDANPEARYQVGDNPVIDLVIPANVITGFVWIAVLDVSGLIFHALPNLNRPDASIETLRDGRAGEVSVRVAFGSAEAEGTNRLEFLVDETTLGKTRILVLHSDAPIFEGIRPMTESAGGFAEALRTGLSEAARASLTLDSRILITEPK